MFHKTLKQKCPCKSLYPYAQWQLESLNVPCEQCCLIIYRFHIELLKICKIEIFVLTKHMLSQQDGYNQQEIVNILSEEIGLVVCLDAIYYENDALAAT